MEEEKEIDRIIKTATLIQENFELREELQNIKGRVETLLEKYKKNASESRFDIMGMK